MEQLENMQEIEAAQTELGQFLVSMMPVPWEKICFYADAAPGTTSIWFALVESETKVICTSDFFFKRYDRYSVEEMESYVKLSDMIEALYEAYVIRFGQNSVWKALYYTLQSDGLVHIDFEHELPKGNMIERHDAVFRKFFDAKYRYYYTKYPSVEIGKKPIS